MLKDKISGIVNLAKNEQIEFHNITDKDTESFLASFRYDSSDIIYRKFIQEKNKNKKTLTDKVDSFVLNR